LTFWNDPFKVKHIHVIVLSTEKSEQEIEKYRQMGADDYLIKPVSFDEYVEVAKNILARADKLKNQNERLNI
jgi:DNA-binding response OmpR family regulator